MVLVVPGVPQVLQVPVPGVPRVLVPEVLFPEPCTFSTPAPSAQHLRHLGTSSTFGPSSIV